MNRKLTATTIIAAAVLTNVGFTMLGSSFNYPDILKEPAADILARFSEHQTGVTFWFTILALSAALFAPIAIGVGKLRADRRMRLRLPAGIAAAVVQTIGLLRWPLARAGLRQDASSTDPTCRQRPRPLPHRPCHPRQHHRRNLRLPTHRRMDGARRASLGTRSPDGPSRRRHRIGAHDRLGVFSPLDLGAIDTINFAGYVLWSAWLIWLAIRVIRGDRRPTNVPATTANDDSGLRAREPRSAFV